MIDRNVLILAGIGIIMGIGSMIYFVYENMKRHEEKRS
jgi:hypothetical protein